MSYNRSRMELAGFMPEYRNTKYRNDVAYLNSSIVVVAGVSLAIKY